MKKIALLVLAIVSMSCGAKKTVSQNVPVVKDTVKKVVEKEIPVKPKSTLTLADIKLLDDKTIHHYSSSITTTDLKKHLVELTSDAFEGRRTGEKGQKLAANYLAEYYKSLEMEAGVYEGQYFQNIPKDFFRGESNFDSENVLGYIHGTEFPEEVIVISAHYDHLGIENGVIHDGADDNGSGTSAVLEIAEAFMKAYIDGEGPKRSVLFMNLTGEEEGLFGSKYYTSNPIYPLENTVCNLNVDMIGRVDDAHTDKPNFVYLIGSDKISTELHLISEAVNNKYTNLDLDYTFNDDKDPNRFYYRSDHYNFAKNGIPIIFYFNGTHADYHKASDTEEKINYEILAKRTQLVFLTAWEIANRKERVKVD